MACLTAALSTRRVTVNPHCSRLSLQLLTLLAQPPAAAVGGLWSCNITAGKVTRYDPDTGAITCVVQIPHVSTPTCVALGGKAMTTLFITSLDGSLNQQTGEMDDPRAEEHAGSLFAVDLSGLPYSGLPEPLFAY